MKNNSCNPCEGCSEIVSSDCVSVQSSISCINMSTGDTLTDVLNALGSQVCNFYNLVDSGSGLTVQENDGSPSYTAINTLQFNQDSGFVLSQPSANKVTVGFVPTFLFPDGDYVTVDMVSTGNIALTGVQSLDGQTGIIGVTRVLVWKQTNKAQNGIYLMQIGSWTRATDSDTSGELNNQVVFANYTKTGTQYGNKYFNQIAVSPVIGADNIIYQVGTGNVNNKWTKGGDTVEQEESIGTIDNFDFPTKTYDIENTRVFKTGQYGVGISASPLARVHIVGQNTAVLDQSILYLENYDQTHSFEYREDGSIYRTNDIYSVASNANDNTSWGEEALENVDLALAQGLTAIGNLALNAAVDTWDSTAVGDGAGEDAFGDDCCYFGKNAGKNNDGDYCIFIGSRSDSSGTFSSSIAMGYNAEIYGNNQLVLGAFDSPITEMYLGEGYRSSTPGNILINPTVGHGTDISGGNLILGGGRNTSNGTNGKILFQTSKANGVSGSTLQSLVTRLTIDYNNISASPYGTASGETYELRFLELAAGGSNYTGFKAPDALAGNVIYTLPTADGTSGYILKTNGSGVLSWINPLSAVSLPITEVGYGTGSGITSDPKFTFDEANDLLGVQDATDYYLYADAVNHDYIFGSQSASYLFMAEETIQIQARKSGAAEIFGIKADGSGIAGAGFTQVGNLQSNTTHIYIDNTNGIHQLKLPIVGTRFSVNTNRTVVSNRLEQAKGTNATAAGDLVLVMDGNSFTITGNTTINAITTTDWQAGSVIRLIFTGTPTVKHDTAGGANTATMKLAAGVDFVISKNPTVLTLVYDGTNFLEVSRSANAV